LKNRKLIKKRISLTINSKTIFFIQAQNGSMLSTPNLEKLVEKEKDSNIFGTDIVPISESKFENNLEQTTRNYRQTPIPDRMARSDGLPRTPTPFKNAMAELGRRRSGL
jgi:hypothetical protein